MVAVVWVLLCWMFVVAWCWLGVAVCMVVGWLVLVGVVELFVLLWFVVFRLIVLITCVICVRFCCLVFCCVLFVY